MTLASKMRLGEGTPSSTKRAIRERGAKVVADGSVADKLINAPGCKLMGHKLETPHLLPAKLLAIRKKLDKTQSQMVEVLNINEISARINEYEHGTRYPSLLTLLRYSKVSGVLINDLADDELAVTELTFSKRRTSSEIRQQGYSHRRAFRRSS